MDFGSTWSNAKCVETAQNICIATVNCWSFWLVDDLPGITWRTRTSFPMLGSTYLAVLRASGSLIQATIDDDKVWTVSALTINPTQIDPFSASVTASAIPQAARSCRQSSQQQFANNLFAVSESEHRDLHPDVVVSTGFLTDYLKLRYGFKVQTGQSYSFTLKYKGVSLEAVAIPAIKLGNIFAATTSIVLRNLTVSNSGYVRIGMKFSVHG